MKKLKLLALLVCIILYSCSENNNEKKNIEEKVEVETFEMLEQTSEREKVIIGETELAKRDEDIIKRNTDKKYAEGEVLVIRKRGYGDLSKSKEKLLRNAKVIFIFSDDNKNEFILLIKDKNFTTEELIEKLKDLPEVSSVEPNYNYNMTLN